MATFLSKIRDITQVEVGDLDNTAVVSLLNTSSNYVVSSIPKRLLPFLAENSTEVVDDTGVVISNTDTILEVLRNGIPCEEVPVGISYQLTYSDSLYFATEMFPKHFIRANRVYIKPSPVAGSPGLIVTVLPPTIAEDTDASSVAYGIISHIIVDYASGLVFTTVASNARTNLGSSNADISDIITDFETLRDALTSAGITIDTTRTLAALTTALNLISGSVFTNNAEAWIDDEDSEMVAAAFQTASEEVQRASQELSTVIAGADTATKKFQADLEKAKLYLEEIMALIQASQSYQAEVTVALQQADEYFKKAQLEISNYVNANEGIIAAQMQAAQGAKK